MLHTPCLCIHVLYQECILTVLLVHCVHPLSCSLVFLSHFRMALSFLRCHHPSENELIVTLLRGVVAADPSSSEAVELARVLWEESKVDG